MSGIAGIFRFDGAPVRHEEIDLLTRSMDHRGPDARDSWHEGSVGLGHTMLRTTPEASDETLPWRDPRTGCVITSDARIDNRDDLIRELRLPSTIPDSRLILAAYEKWGDRCPEKLLGDFAFAVWDPRDRSLFAARDIFGVRPFVYHSGRGVLVLASEAQAVAALDDTPTTLNEPMIADVLVTALEGIDNVETLYREIVRLPPAHRLIASAHGVRVERYWQPDPSRALRLSSDEEYEEAFRSVFTEAVRCRLRSSSPPACNLSGGVDSSSIVGVARTLGSVKVLSGVAEPGVDCEETRTIRAMQPLPGIDAHELRPSELGPLTQDLERMCLEAVEPFNASMILPHAIQLTARRAGISVLIGGIDGDYVASHEPGCLQYLMRKGRWIASARLARDFARFYRGSYAPWSSAWGLLYLFGRGAFVPERVKMSLGSLRGRRATEEALRDTVIDREFARRANVGGRLEALGSHLRMPAGTDPRERKTRELSHPYVICALENCDRLAALCGVEPRHPFFDRRLVEFCLAVPWEQKVRNGWSKSLVRRAMAGLVPDEVRWRRGRWDHLGPAFLGAFLDRQGEALRELVGSGLSDLGGYVDAAAVTEAFRRYRKSGNLEDGQKVWEAACLRSWLLRNAPAPARLRAAV